MFFSHEHIEILVNSAGEQLFFRQREGPWLPSLKLLHKCKHILTFFVIRRDFRIYPYYLYSYIPVPFFLTQEQVDKGAIKFVLSGANIMCPGLTSPGAILTSAPKGTTVVSFYHTF